MLPRTPPSPPPPPPAATAQKLGRVENSAAAVKIDAAMACTWTGSSWMGAYRKNRQIGGPRELGLGVCAGVGAVDISQRLEVFGV